MARPLLLRIFLDELPLKLLSLVLAVTLFVLVRTDKDAATGAYVKVIYTLPEDRVLVSDPVPEVRVGVRGPWTRLQRFDERSIEPIHVDLNRVRGPELRFDEDMVKLPVGLRVSSIMPSEVRLEFEPRVTRTVPVQPLVEGEPAEGFHVLKVSASPQSVRIDGAQREVMGVKHVATRPLRIGEARGPVKGEVALETLPPHVRYVDGQSVTVDADIAPAMVERTFDALPVHVIGLQRLEGQVEPANVRLTLRGPALLVQAINAGHVSLDVDASLVDSRPPARYVRSVAVTGLPAGVAAEVQPDRIMLTTRRKRP